ncbi:MAG: glycoside hydrolase family 3 N-terminal domain-containing protein [Bacillota bacterium]
MKRNNGIEQKIDALIAKMTLAEKIGQLAQYTNGAELTGPGGDPVDLDQLTREGAVGSVLNYTGVADTKKIQDIAVNESRLGIPLMFGYDVIHGFKTGFPIPLAQAASWNMELIEQAEQIAALEASAAGVNWAFTPMLDIARDPRWGRVIEGAGEDTYLGACIATARVRGLQGDNPAAADRVLACAKHYVGYGAAQAGRDYFTTDIPERTLREVYLPPFQAAVAAGVGSVMPAFNEIDGVPMTANRTLIKDVLIDEFGFNGCLVSDWTAVHELVAHGVAANDKEAAALAINACVDIDMCSGSYSKYLAELVAEGVVEEATIDDSVRRVLRGKFALNLFEQPHKNSDLTREAQIIEAPEHFEFSRQLARECIVLLKNQNDLLPLAKNIASIAVVGPFADSKLDACGAWRAQTDSTKATTILAGIRAAVSEETVVTYAVGCSAENKDMSQLAAAVSAVQQSEVAIVVLGEFADSSGEAACLTDLNFAGGQCELIRAVHATGKPVILVAQSGRPFTIAWEAENLPAIIQAWHLGSRAGAAVADVLFADFNPCGKLPMTMPRSVGQIPIFYNCKNTGRPFDADNKYCSKYLDLPNTPLYPFGYGLSYSQFDYSNLRLSSTEMAANETVTVTVDVKNCGSRAGKEVVQLYIRDLVASITRPVKELKGFRKIELAAGEQKTVEFEITTAMLEFYGQDMQKIVEAGEFMVFVGGNSEECLQTSFWLN